MYIKFANRMNAESFWLSFRKYKALSSNLEILHSQGSSYEVLSNGGWLGSKSCSSDFLFETELFLSSSFDFATMSFCLLVYFEMSVMTCKISLSLLLPRSNFKKIKTLLSLYTTIKLQDVLTARKMSIQIRWVVSKYYSLNLCCFIP